MNMTVKSTFTFNDFVDAIDTISNLVQREGLMEKALDCYLENRASDAYIDLLTCFFEEDETEYGDSFHKYWNNWDSMVTCTLITFIYGVLNEEGLIATPTNHNLCTLDGETISIDDITVLWKIVTGQIAVKEKV